MPCDAHGKEFTEEDNVFVDAPEDLIGQNLHFRFKILGCRGLPGRYKDVYCSYSMYLDEEVVCTKKMSNQSNPDFKHDKQFDFKPVTPQ
ncbi:C2 domain, partial [Trinorchestia longiramus]